MEQAYRPLLDAFAAEGGDAEALADMIFVKPDYLEATITFVRREHGGLEQYLTGTLGLDSGLLTALRSRLT